MSLGMESMLKVVWGLPGGGGVFLDARASMEVLILNLRSKLHHNILAFGSQTALVLSS